MLVYELLYKYPNIISGIAILENDNYNLLLYNHPESNVTKKELESKLKYISNKLSCTYDVKATSYFLKRFFDITLNKTIDLVTLSSMSGNSNKYNIPVDPSVQIIQKVSMYNDLEDEFVKFPRYILERHFKNRLKYIFDTISNHLSGPRNDFDLDQYVNHFVGISKSVGVLEAAGYSVDTTVVEDMLSCGELKNHWSKIRSLSRMNYPIYSIDTSSTGRLASGSKYGAKFNALAIPKNIRKCIVPKRDIFVELDYTSFEFNVLLFLYGPDILIEKLKNIYDVICEEANIENRDIVKSIVFKKIYGIGGTITDLEIKRTLTENNIGQSKVYIFNKYLDWIEDVKDLIQQTVMSSKENYIKTAFGRKINFSNDNISRKNLLFNNVIQSTASDIALNALSKIQEYLSNKNSEVILFCHDSFLIDLDLNEKNSINNMSLILQNILQNHTMPVNISIGKNYGSMRKINV